MKRTRTPETYNRLCRANENPEMQELITEALLESTHNNHDGFRQRDKSVINAFVHDVLLYAESVMKDKKGQEDK